MVFKYPSYYNLLTELGRIDCIIEITEIAVRDFLQNLKDSDDQKKFMQEKWKTHGIMVSYDKSSVYHNQIILSYISTVYHLTETFFYELQSEYKDETGEVWAFVQGKTKLSQVLEFIRNKKRFNHIDYIDDILIDTFNYYHQLRVYFSHKKTTSIAETESKWNLAVPHYNQELLNKYKVKSPPKKLDKIDFEDFFLFTQISKELALKISSFCYPSAEIIAKKRDIVKLKKFKDSKKRIHDAIDLYLKTQYGFEKENDSDMLIDQIIENL